MQNKRNIINSNENKTIFGFYPYTIRLEKPKPSKALIKELLYNSIKVEIKKHKINNQTLVIITLFLDKTILFPFNYIIYKYEIFIYDEFHKINWIGAKKYVVLNNLDEEFKNIFECKFCFLTSLKGLIEVNKISIKFYKKGGNFEENEENLLIKHMTKPLSIYIE